MTSCFELERGFVSGTPANQEREERSEISNCGQNAAACGRRAVAYLIT